MEKQKLDIYQIVTDKIISILESGTIPWRKPWNDAGMPRNLISKKAYRGVNVLLLASLGFKQNLFATFDQIKAVGGSVRKGQKSQIVVFWKWIDANKEDTTPPDEKKPQKPMLRYYHVFNMEQCDGIPSEFIPSITPDNVPIELCDRVVSQMPNPPAMQHMENEAYYLPQSDILNMPEMEYFVKSEAYYATLFHELIHSTGHSSRLNRKEFVESTKFGSYDYSTEELTTEIGSCYLQNYTGIAHDVFSNSAAYIQGWLGKLKNDKRCIIYASGQAQRATDYILGIKPEVSPNSIAQPQVQKV
jgi:antirestriction protein ArdC